ncbi:MAG TPA: glycoside hydrolase family 3 C-terminal domain-containing protein [Candidatus Acidoferrales bacterium]|nr:glycoside hydrolase family 3 C-terminal domain-containing protein [Candidatus Acidoferrales bacterium]
MPRRAVRVTFSLVLAVLTFAIFDFARQQPLSDDDPREESLLSQLTLDEKLDMLGGVDGFYTRGVSRLGIPSFKMADGPIGVRNYGPATTMAGGIALAATWDPALAEKVGATLGADARSKGVHFLLGPGVNIYRAPNNGRNFEYFGEDPWLASRIAVAYIKGVQSEHVAATIKHFLGNNSEFDRHNTDSGIGERALREIYLPVFESAVKEAHVGAVMDSYNLTNGAHMTQNGRLNIGVLTKEFGFDGVLMSDWSATYDGVAAANAGLDLEMPSARFMTHETLAVAVAHGEVSVATIDDKIRRLLRLAVRFRWLDGDHTVLSIPRYNLEGREVALQAAREGMVLLKNDREPTSEASTAQLRYVLPLDKSRINSIAVIGPDAYPAAPVGGGSARVEPFHAISFLEGIANYLGSQVRTYYNRGIPALADDFRAANFFTDSNGSHSGLAAEYFSTPDLQGQTSSTGIVLGQSTIQGGNLAPTQNWSSLRYSGYFMPKAAGEYDAIVQCPGEDCRFRLYINDKLALDAWDHALYSLNTAHLTINAIDISPQKIVLEHKRSRAGAAPPRVRIGIVEESTIVDPQAIALAKQANAAVVCVGFDPETEGEGSDRAFELPPGQEALIRAIAAVNHRTIVVITSGGAVDVRRWLDRVQGVIEAWYPGQEGGTALAEILFGTVNPSGRLPVTFERAPEDNPAHDNYYPQKGTNRIEYKEGVFTGYRGYQNAIAAPANSTRTFAKPLFPFGFGLSYSSFRYANLAVNSSEIARGGIRGKLWQISFDATNTGTRAGTDVSEIFITPTKSDGTIPLEQLKGFARTELKPGETRHVTISLGGWIPPESINARVFSTWDEQSHSWHSDPAAYEVLLCRDANTILLRAPAQSAAH